MKLELSRQIFEKKKILMLNFIKTTQQESSCSIRTDGRTGMTKLIVAFLNFANVSETVTLI